MSYLAYVQSREAAEQRGYAMEEAASARKAREEADAQRKLAEQRLARITDGIRMKQVVLAGDRERIRAYLDSDLANRSLRFTAQAQDLGYRNPQGQPVYRFSLFRSAPRCPRERRRSPSSPIAWTIRPSRTPSGHGPDREFTASYTGWGCLRQVVALIEYVNPDRSPEIAAFDMCAAINR
jgi:hypothetical protein